MHCDCDSKWVHKHLNSNPFRRSESMSSHFGVVDCGCGGHLKLMLVKVDKHCSTLVIHCDVSLSIWKARVIGLPEVESLNISVKESGFVLDASAKESDDALDASVKHLY